MSTHSMILILGTAPFPSRGTFAIDSSADSIAGSSFPAPVTPFVTAHPSSR